MTTNSPVRGTRAQIGAFETLLNEEAARRGEPPLAMRYDYQYCALVRFAIIAATKTGIREKALTHEARVALALRPRTGYAASIAEVTGHLDPEVCAHIENAMRVERPTLDALTRPQFAALARRSIPVAVMYGIHGIAEYARRLHDGR